MTEEEIVFEQSGPTGRFYLVAGGHTVAEMFIHFAGSNRLVIDHTEVHPGNNGKGYGKKLVVRAVEYARENKLRIIPVCPYARSVFDKTDEYNDVLG